MVAKRLTEYEKFLIRKKFNSKNVSRNKSSEIVCTGPFKHDLYPCISRNVQCDQRSHFPFPADDANVVMHAFGSGIALDR